MFMGTYNNSIDAKNRMIVPAKFREELGYKVVLTLGIDNCLYLYPASEWAKFVEKLSMLPISDPKARNFVRSFTGNAEECEMDRQGRITLPQTLREKTSISKELTTIGCMDKIEIWSREEYEKGGDDIVLDRAKVAEGIVEYGI